MTQTIMSLTCPGCGAPTARSDKSCNFCGIEVIITSFSNLNDLPLAQLNKYATAYKGMLDALPEDSEISSSLAMCYLKLKLYDKAQPAFDAAIEKNFNNPETYFYAAVCMLKGNKAFIAQRATIDRVEAYLNAALMIEPRAVFYYFQAYIKYDYYNRKYFLTSPTYSEAHQKALAVGLKEFEIEQLYTVLGVLRPSDL